MENKVLERFYVILKLPESVQDIPVVKTFIQKATYILKEGFGVILNYEFKLHYLKPYSERVSSDVSNFREWRSN